MYVLLNTQNPRKRHPRRETLPREQFGTIESEGMDLDEDLVFGWGGDGALLDFQGVGSAGFVDHGCFHGLGHCGG